MVGIGVDSCLSNHPDRCWTYKQNKLQLKKLPIKYIFHTQTEDVELKKKKKNPLSGHAEAIKIRTIETLTSLGLHHLVL